MAGPGTAGGGGLGGEQRVRRGRPEDGRPRLIHRAENALRFGGYSESPLTLTLSPEGRGDPSVLVLACRWVSRPGSPSVGSGGPCRARHRGTASPGAL